MSTWVLIRGLAREAGHWGRFPQALETALGPCQVLTPDLPGNGVLHERHSPLRVEAMADAVAQSVGASGHAPPYRVIAVSLGAMVATAWAAKRPQYLERMVLINTSMRPFSPFYQRLQPGAWPAFATAAMPGQPPETREAAILKLISNNESARTAALPDWTDIARIRPVSPANLARQLWAAARYRAPAKPPSTPTLVLASTRDRLASVTCSRALADAWGCPIAEHPTAGHDLTLDDSAWVIAQIANWMPPETPETG